MRSRSKFRRYVKWHHLANQNFHSNRIGEGEVGETYAVHLRLIGKLVGDFLLVIIELFFARCFRFVTTHACDRQTDVQMSIARCDLTKLDAHKNELATEVTSVAVLVFTGDV